MKQLTPLYPLAIALVSLASSPYAAANEAQMNHTLKLWQQEEGEYQAALTYAPNEQARQELLKNPPLGLSTAQKLWQICTTRTGTREIAPPSSDIPQNRFAKKESAKKVPIYAYEEAWAGPAVLWLLSHPEALVRVMPAEKASDIVSALLKSVHNTHYAQADVLGLCPKLAGIDNVIAYNIAEKIFMRNPDPSVRACAALTMSIMLNQNQIQHYEGSESMANAKRLYYIKSALNIAPPQCRYGQQLLEESALEQLHLITQLSPGCIPPQVEVTNQQGGITQLPIIKQPQLLIFCDLEQSESLQLLQRCDQIAEKYPQIQLIPIAREITEQRAQEILQAEGIAQAIYRDKAGQAAHAYRVPQYPYVAFIKHDSKLEYRGPADLNLQVKMTEYLDTLPPEQLPAPNSNERPVLREMPALLTP